MSGVTNELIKKSKSRSVISFDSAEYDALFPQANKLVFFLIVRRSKSFRS